VTSEIKAVIILAIGGVVALLIQMGWEKGYRSNKIIADIVGVVAAIVYLFSADIIADDLSRLAILLIAAAFIIFLIFKGDSPKSQATLKEPEFTKQDIIDINDEPETEPEPDPMESAEDSYKPPEPEEEPSFADKEPAEEPEPTLKEEALAEDVELVDVGHAPEEPVMEEPKKEEPEVAYQDGLIGTTVKEEPKKEPEAPAEPPKKAAPKDTFEQYITEKLSDSSAQRNAGVNLKNQGKSDEAIEKWREAIRINPEDFKAYILIAQALKEKGLLDEAAIQFENALNINPRIAEAHYALGFDYSAKGQIHKAIGAFEDFIRYAAPHEAEMVDEVKRMIEHLKGQVTI